MRTFSLMNQLFLRQKAYRTLKALQKKRDLSRIKEGWGLFFILGIVMLNYPFLHIFNKPVSIFGIPLLVLYLFVGWPISIGIIYLFAHTLGAPQQATADPAAPPDEENG